jgi:glycosyltransferase involved in cell wall biosynthesis
MIRVLLIPSSDYLGHPFPQRYNQIFERIHDDKNFEVHVVRFKLYSKPKLKTKLIVHETREIRSPTNLALYYLFNTPAHLLELRKIIREESIDVLVMGNLALPLAYLLLKQFIREKIFTIFDLQDYYPTSAVGYLTDVQSVLGRALSSCLEVMLAYILRHVDLVTTPGSALKEYVKKLGAKSVEILPNGVGEQFLLKHEGTKVRAGLGFGAEDIVVGYVGSIEYWLDMKPLFKAVNETKRKNLPVKLLLIGGRLQTNYAKKVKQWIEEYNIDHETTWLDFLPYEQIPEYISSMNLATIPFDSRQPTAYYASPNKLWEYLSQQIPVISTPIPEMLRYREFLSLAQSEKDYAAHIHGYSMDREVYRSKTVKAQRMLKERTWSAIAEQLKPILEVGCRKSQ